ncbi:hypothetical protein BDW62DRAFT_12778 [Aspergillus aurantiobrunneus]
MPLILSRTRASGRVTDLNVVSNLGRSISAGARSRPAPWNKAVLSSTKARRYLSNEAKDVPGGSERRRTPQHIQDILLKSEFEEKGDVRRYLRKWQEVTPNILDPIRRTEPSSTAARPEPWVGNMVSSREANDGEEEALPLTDEDMTEFVNIADEGEGVNDYLQPGDLVGFKTVDEVLRFNIYVRSVNKQQQFYTQKGKWRIAYPSDIDFVIKGFTTPESVTPLHPFFPETTAELQPEMQSVIEGGVPRDAGAHLLQMINQFSSQVHELYRVNSARFDSIYDIVADEEKQLQMTLEELACKALEIGPDQVNDVIRYTVHRAARQYPFLMETDRSTLFTNQYVVYPTSVATIFDKVVTWYHEHQHYLVRAVTAEEARELRNHPLQKFIQKAQRLIRQSRKFRSPTSMVSVGPSSDRFQPGQDNNPLIYREMKTEAFSDDDKIIIKFLQLWCIPPRRMSAAALRSAGSHIMRATGMYSALESSSGSVGLMLQELGVFMPWENPRLLDQDLALPGHGLGSDDRWRQVEAACQKFSADEYTDRMATMRKDWGDLPVYCVDSVDAEEIDDGVSLERIPGSNDTFWVRVHVANPSAFLDSSDEIMKYAASRLQTLYVPERTYHMLPKALTQGHFSLASGRPSLTFSAKMNLNGEVLETDISNGVVRNVIYLTPDKLRSVLGAKPFRPMEALVVGGKFPKRPSRVGIRDELADEDEATFRTLRQIMLGFREQRRKNGAMEWPQSLGTPVSVSAGKAPLQPSDVNVEMGRYILGDPIIQLWPQKFDPHEVPDLTKHDLVSTLMNLACWVSGRWCAERNIPAVYDGTYYHPEYPRVTSENISEYGGQATLQLGAPRGVSSSLPLHHAPLGLDAYVKSTSPLRRYTDLLAHYQIEAALRFEHEHGRRLNATPEDEDGDGDSPLPFTHDQVETHLAQSRWKRNRLRNIDQGSKQFWACMLLFRAFYFGECKLPRTVECLVHKSYSQTGLAGTKYDEGHMGVITSMGVWCSIAVPPGMMGVDILSVVEGEITAVNLGRSLVMVKATRVVKPFQRVGEWA